jgi:hypothetical protein
MALNISVEGLGVITNAQSADFASWGITGSGGSSINQDDQIFYQGTTSVASAISSGKNGWVWFNTAATYNFTSGGNAYQQRIYIWFNCTTPKAMNTKATPGLAIRVGGSTTAYRTFTLAGNDDLNGYSGGWKCVVIDPTLTGSITDGTGYNANTINYIGIYYNGSTASRSNNIFVDTIAIGKGVRIVGTETSTGAALSEVVDYCTDLTNRAFGMLQKREGIFYAYGKLFIGGAITGSGGADNQTTTFGTKNRVLKWGNSEYWSGSAWVTGMGNGFNGLTIADHASYKTVFTDGILVGSDAGRSGNVYIGAGSINTTFSLYGGLHADSRTYLYGTILSAIDNGITWGDDSNHKCFGATFQSCGQVNPVGAPTIRNSIFAETASAVAALKWNSSISIQASKFIANTTGAAIEHNTWNGNQSGTCDTTDGTGVTLHDTGATFNTGSNVLANDIVYNETTGGYGTVTAITDATHLDCSAGLSTGGWTATDVYSIARPVSYTNLTFSGNTTDINNTTSPANVVAVSKAGTSNPTTKSGFTVIQGSVTVKVTVKDKGGDLINNVQTAVYQTSDRTELMNKDTVTGVAETTFAGTTPVEVEVRCRKASSTGTRYKNFSSIQTVQSGTGLDLAVTLIEDAYNNATS